MAVSVVLPTYLECENIGPMIERCGQALAGREHELIIVDDSSPDGTADVARRHAQGLPHVRVVVRIGERGLRSAIERGIAEARYPIVAWMDTDGSMPPEDLPRLLDPIERGHADMVVGSRFVVGGAIKGQDAGQHRPNWLRVARNLWGTEDSILAVFLSSFGNWIIQRILGLKFSDWTSGFVAVRMDALRAIPLEGRYGEYFIGLVYGAFARGWVVYEVPYRIRPRLAGVSKTGETLVDYAKMGRQYIGTALRLRRQSHFTAVASSRA